MSVSKAKFSPCRKVSASSRNGISLGAPRREAMHGRESCSELVQILRIAGVTDVKVVSLVRRPVRASSNSANYDTVDLVLSEKFQFPLDVQHFVSRSRQPCAVPSSPIGIYRAALFVLPESTADYLL